MITATILLVFVVLTYVAWRRYLWAAEAVPDGYADTCEYSLTDVFGDRHLINAPHQKGARWLTGKSEEQVVAMMATPAPSSEGAQ